MLIKIVSGSDRPYLRSDENHRRYAERHGYPYRFDTSIYSNLPTPHFRKLHSVQAALEESDWVFWLDDDAYFTRPETPLENFLEGMSDNTFLVICASPVNLQGGWTFISSGQFFLRNCALSRNFLQKVLATPLETVQSWWDPERYGMFTHGDQDCFVYVLVTHELLRHTKVFSYTAFNSRPYHYKDRLDEHFLVHFPGVPDKEVAVENFGRRFGVDSTLIAPLG